MNLESRTDVDAAGILDGVRIPHSDKLEIAVYIDDFKICNPQPALVRGVWGLHVAEFIACFELGQSGVLVFRDWKLIHFGEELYTIILFPRESPNEEIEVPSDWFTELLSCAIRRYDFELQHRKT